MTAPTARPHGLLLAAGAGRRFGGPKALATDPDGTRWLHRAVAVLRAGGCATVTVVVGAGGPEARRLVALLDDPAVDVTDATDWESGISASLRAGLQALQASPASAAVVSLVDLPDVTAEVVARVLRAGSGPTALTRATYDDRPGHPVVLGRDHWSGVLDASRGDSGAMAYLALTRPRLVECGDLATGRDIDTAT